MLDNVIFCCSTFFSMLAWSCKVWGQERNRFWYAQFFQCFHFLFFFFSFLLYSALVWTVFFCDNNNIIEFICFRKASSKFAFSSSYLLLLLLLLRIMQIYLYSFMSGKFALFIYLSCLYLTLSTSKCVEHLYFPFFLFFL